MKKHEIRLRRLEAATGAHVVGLRRDDGPVIVEGEEMSPEAFERAFPNGILIHLIRYENREGGDNGE